MVVKNEQIKKIWFDETNILCIQPQSAEFKMIYRSAMNIDWNESKKYLHHRIVGSMSPVEWFQQIIDAVMNEYGLRLFITKQTIWVNVDSTTKHLIEVLNGIEE